MIADILTDVVDLECCRNIYERATKLPKTACSGSKNSREAFQLFDMDLFSSTVIRSTNFFS